MSLQAVSVVLGCPVSESTRKKTDSPGSLVSPGSSLRQSRQRSEASSQREGTAAELWQEFQHRCRLPTAIIEGPGEELKDALAILREDGSLARTTVVWRHDKGSARERLPLIRSCARLGLSDIVSVLLVHNLDALLGEEVVLDAIRNDRSTVVCALLENVLFQPREGFLGYALGECGAARSASCASRLIGDKRCTEQALQKCNHERFRLPVWGYVRALEKAIARAVEAGADDDAASMSGGDQECLQLLTAYAKPHLQDEEWHRILRLAILAGEEGPVSALLREYPRLLSQAERLDFPAGSQGAAAQRTLAYMHHVGLTAQD